MIFFTSGSSQARNNVLYEDKSFVYGKLSKISKHDDMCNGKNLCDIHWLNWLGEKQGRLESKMNVFFACINGCIF